MTAKSPDPFTVCMSRYKGNMLKDINRHESLFSFLESTDRRRIFRTLNGIRKGDRFPRGFASLPLSGLMLEGEKVKKATASGVHSFRTLVIQGVVLSKLKLLRGSEASRPFYPRSAVGSTFGQEKKGFEFNCLPTLLS